MIKLTLCSFFLLATSVEAFTPSNSPPDRARRGQNFHLSAKPRRLEGNVPGVVYVNDRCINCAACSALAPSVFARRGSYHVVQEQPPSHPGHLIQTRAAMLACPVAAIRLETLAERKHRSQTPDNVEWSQDDERIAQYMKSSAQNNTSPFPRPFLLDEVENVQPIPNIYWVGHHNEHSFGAVPYLLRARHHNRKEVWILIDTPRFSTSSVRDVQSLTGENGPDYLFMTHVDDTADHEKWNERFPNLKQIFHAGDLGRYNWRGDKSLESVDILLQHGTSSHSPNDPLIMYDLDGKIVDNLEKFQGNVIILHTPGHSPGSVTLYKLPDDSSPGVLFTGDTYAYTPYKKMTGFGRYGRDRSQQTNTLAKFLQLKDWVAVAPGHGHPRDYRNLDDSIKVSELKEAQNDLLARQ